MTNEERHELFELLDTRYQRIDTCAGSMNDIEKKLHNDDKRLAVIEFQQKVNNWLTAAIASGIVALVIKVFLG